MRTIGLIGGMSWISTALYYRVLNEGVSRALGGVHSAKTALWSVDFHEVQRLQSSGDLEGEERLLVDAARRLEAAGAGCIVICSNTMHRRADRVEEAVDIPLIHIVDAVGETLAEHGHRRAGVIGTRIALADRLFPARLARHGIEVLLPGPDEVTAIQAVIERECDPDRVSEPARTTVASVLTGLTHRGADALVLACTSLGRTPDRPALPIPTYDSALLHAHAALRWSLADHPPEAFFSSLPAA